MEIGKVRLYEEHAIYFSMCVLKISKKKENSDDESHII